MLACRQPDTEQIPVSGKSGDVDDQYQTPRTDADEAEAAATAALATPAFASMDALEADRGAATTVGGMSEKDYSMGSFGA